MNIFLVHKIAAFQARVDFLNSVSDVFVELSDMTMFRKIKNDVEEFIQIQRQSNELAADPSSVALNDIKGVEIAIKKIGGIYKHYITIGDIFTNPKTFPITIGDFNALVTKYQDKMLKFSGEVSEATRLFTKTSWDINGDISPALLEFAQLSCPKSALHKVDRTDFYYFALQSGKLWQKLQDTFLLTQNAINSLLAKYENDKLCWTQAEKCAASGNFKQATYILTKSASNNIVDDSYYAVENYIESWKQEANSYLISGKYKQSLTLAMKPLPLNVIILFIERAERLAIIKSLDFENSNALAQVRNYDKSEFKQECENALNKKAEILAELIAIIRNKTWTICLAYAATVVGIILTVCLGNLIQAKNQAEATKVEAANEKAKAARTEH